MGQCTAYENNLGDLKTEMDLKSSIIKNFHHAAQASVPSTHTSYSVDLDAYYSPHLHAITCIQACWRGRQERKAVFHLLRVQEQPNSYFTKAYSWETLRTGQLLPQIVEERPAYRYCSGAVYKGHWLGGFRQGEGSMLWPDGAKYDGMWNFGYAAGRGTFVLPTGETFSGLWKFNKSCMRMSLMLDSPKETGRQPEDGYVWLAQLEVLSLPSRGEPRRTWESAKKTSLEEAIQSFKEQLCSRPKLPRFKCGMRQRVKNLETKDALYSGEMKDGEKDGWGRNVWNNGDLYEGEWEANEHCGYGISSWMDGSRHVGFYKGSKKEGVGEYIWEDGSQYLGEWKDNQMHGKGKYMWTDGRTYLGEWLNGQMHGFGVFIWTDGRRYEGGWYQGKKHGEGITFTAEGRYTRDIWKHGKMIKPDV